jgi:hypothetical protein
MSAWREKAIECIPELRKDFEDPEESIYLIFNAMLSAAIDFHRENNIDRLQKIYDFAEWCFRQKSKELWNAAGVSDRSMFYYESVRDDSEVEAKLRSYVENKLLCNRGCQEYFKRMRREGIGWNHKRVERVYRKMGLSRRRKKKGGYPIQRKDPWFNLI